MPFIFLAIVAVGAWAIGRSASSPSHATPPAPPQWAALPAPAAAPVIASGRAYGRGYQAPAHVPHAGAYRAHVPVHAFGGRPREAIDPRESPMHALRYYIEIGEFPPPFIVQCALAQANLAGQYDLAREISLRYGDQRIIDVGPGVGNGGGGSVPPAPGAGLPPVPPPQTAPASAQAGAPGYAAPGVLDDEMRAAYAAMGLDPAYAPQSSDMVPEPGPDNTIVSGALPREMLPRVLEPRHLSRDEIVPRATASPLGGVGVDVASWQRFVELVSREAPTYRTSKHVGQFRQRRERLIELGLDPDLVSRSSHEQLVALEREISDAHHHAREGELIMYVGSYVDVPMPDAIDLGPRARGSVQVTQEQITLSGLLGLIQAAGLDGACSWLESPIDRERFPNTTLAFVRCNGVF